MVNPRPFVRSASSSCSTFLFALRIVSFEAPEHAAISDLNWASVSRSTIAIAPRSARSGDPKKVRAAVVHEGRDSISAGQR